MEPSLIGGEVNYILMAYQNRHNRLIQYKVGPDPSSIDSCMIGGIVFNNLSRMSCGAVQNSYYTGTDMWITFVDRTTLNASDRCLWCNICICLVIRKRTRNQGIQSSPVLVNQWVGLIPTLNRTRCIDTTKTKECEIKE